jgi:hypothetical protein
LYPDIFLGFKSCEYIKKQRTFQIFGLEYKTTAAPGIIGKASRLRKALEDMPIWVLWVSWQE